MSWSISMIGKPDRIVEELDSYSSSLSGQSKEEYDEAKPSLQSLVKLSVGEGIVINLQASGHATITEGKKTYGVCSVSLSQFYSKLLV